MVAVTASPLWLVAVPQALVIFWSPGNVNRSVQPLTGVVPVLPMVTLATKPPAHWLDVA